MNAKKIFFDTNTLLYLLSSDSKKADWISSNLQQSNVISVQVLNEFTSASLRKIKISNAELDEFLDLFTSTFNVMTLDVETFNTGLMISRRYGYQHYDSMIIAAALQAGCERLYSEDMQHRQIINKRLQIVNPFA
ncbi:PIN domain-containing protein [Polynucleobacter sp. IMCC30063]|uniref:PIN domain-containing protein n=1 Tax=unclassified Polynucleobacter TaxID=2640945 RepID=UPI001F22518C|nr:MULTISPECIES: PIN domain-containing protein [unclassified Polynucleobacter]MCE7506587.1 PIN domain-containing protein [Polynucleobacter sp. IMCC30063]MCE7526723.1 PIN domain-containing protein [Polynucleobacter sp. IMCC 30228]MCE7530200.1 PIN domain-containing protein [Polynucleobacter sp. IMCC 29146]